MNAMRRILSAGLVLAAGVAALTIPTWSPCRNMVHPRFRQRPAGVRVCHGEGLHIRRGDPWWHLRTRGVGTRRHGLSRP